MLDRKEIDVPNYTIAAYLDMNPTNVSRYIKRGDRMDLVYAVLTRTDLTDKQKKNYIMGTSLSEYFKSKIWRVYQERVN